MKGELRRNLFLGVIAVIVVVVVFTTGNSESKGENTEYYCDVKNLRLSTVIEIEKDNEDYALVKGNVSKILTDPLTMYDLEDNKIGYASDSYHFLAQDSHAIYIDNQLKMEMVGLVDFIGESYDIYDSNEEKIANVKFNMTNTVGQMHDTNGELIADYTSRMFINDFKVRIYESCELDQNAILMMFCSYYSDQAADSKASTSSNKGSSE